MNMADSPFYKELATLDRGIADRWASTTNDGKVVKVTAKMVDDIFLPVLKSGKITENQAKAIIHLAASGTLDNSAMLELVAVVRVADDHGELEEGASMVLAKDDDLKDVYRAIVQGTGNINFISPKSNIQYIPSYYLTIKWLIEYKQIHVYRVKDAGLRRFARLNLGVYRSDSNRLFLYDNLTPAEQSEVTVHEATHAIQDWLDLKVKTKFAEADAFICGAVADRTLGFKPTIITSGAIDPAAEAALAAQFVVDKKAVSSNKAWLSAYDRVVKAIEKHPAYAKAKDKELQTVEKGEGDSEKKRFKAVLDALKKYLPAAP
jgi:hypothetical protein